MALATYGHVIEELEGAETQSAEQQIRAAREAHVPLMFPRSRKRQAPKKKKSLQKDESPLTDANRRPPRYHRGGKRGHDRVFALGVDQEVDLLDLRLDELCPNWED